MAEFAQLALDAAVPPARVLPRQPEDEGPDLGGESGTAARIRPPVDPRAPDQFAMPLQDRVGLEQQHPVGCQYSESSCSLVSEWSYTPCTALVVL
jgi:hypothetical protein